MYVLIECKEFLLKASDSRVIHLRRNDNMRKNFRQLKCHLPALSVLLKPTGNQRIQTKMHTSGRSCIQRRRLISEVDYCYWMLPEISSVLMIMIVKPHQNSFCATFSIRHTPRTPKRLNKTKQYLYSVVLTGYLYFNSN